MLSLNFLSLMGLVMGLVVVSSNPSPFFAALGLVLAAGMGCGVLAGHGGTFLSLILFLIYLGGMLVVFAYSAALAAEPYPEGMGSWEVLANAVGYFLLIAVGWVYLSDKWYEVSWTPADDMLESSVFRADVGGVGLIYSSGGWALGITAGALLLTLVVVFHVVWGLSRGAIRPV